MGLTTWAFVNPLLSCEEVSLLSVDDAVGLFSSKSGQSASYDARGLHSLKSSKKSVASFSVSCLTLRLILLDSSPWMLIMESSFDDALC